MQMERTRAKSLNWSPVLGTPGWSAMQSKRALDVIQIDAFTDRPYGGNPAMVVLEADRLSDENIRAIAGEMSVGQTVFVLSSKTADFRLSYWTPGGEMDFSGHLTVAAFLALIEVGLAEIPQDVTMFELETKAGMLQVEVVKNEQTALHEIQITHEKAEFLETYDPVDYAEALGLSLADIMSPHPVQTVSTGTPQLMIPVNTPKSLERIQPDWKRLNELQQESDWVSIQVFSPETGKAAPDVHVRHFAPALGINEDPVTGSAAASMCWYMLRYGIVNASYPVTSIVIAQGSFVNRPGRIFVEVRGDEDVIQHVKVSGTGVIVLRGKLYF
ncbi:PhzF family phenazine biosynthesis protein [Candidatus Thorarchaeota archaeon]|nr:MAG: PhzF family phenazine biosynthesis protein [Candidatus Thorarchaeota archaeon]